MESLFSILIYTERLPELSPLQFDIGGLCDRSNSSSSYCEVSNERETVWAGGGSLCRRQTISLMWPREVERDITCVETVVALGPELRRYEKPNDE